MAFCKLNTTHHNIITFGNDVVKYNQLFIVQYYDTMISKFNSTNYLIWVINMAKAEKYIPTEKAQAFLDKVTDVKHDRQIINGLKKFLDDRAPEDMLNFYTPEEKQALIDIKGTEQDIESRMPVKITRHY